MPRPIWKGHISFGLVYIPVTLMTAEKHTEMRFHLLDSRDKSRVRYERINEATGKTVPWNEVTRAFEFKKNKFVALDEKDFKNAAVESSQNIEIESFVDAQSIDPIYFYKPYYLVPDKKGEKGYVLLRETLRRTNKAGIAKVVIRTRQYLAAVIVVEKAMVLNLLRFAAEIIEQKEFNFPDESLKNYKITPKELEISEQLVKAMSAAWDPKKYHDDYREALMKLVEKKEKGLPITVKTAPKRESAKVIDFMSLLKKSVEEKKGRKLSKSAKKHRRAHTTHRKRSHR